MRRYEEWEGGVIQEIKAGPVWKFYGYRKALFLYDLVWVDCEHWQKDRRGRAIVDQIIRSAGSISANIEEGNGRGWGRDQARFLKFALGSARETKGWYWRGRSLLPKAVLHHRLALLEEIIALLVTHHITEEAHRLRVLALLEEIIALLVTEIKRQKRMKNEERRMKNEG